MRSVPVMRGVHVAVVQQRGRLCVGIAAGVETLQRGVHVIHQRLQIHIILVVGVPMGRELKPLTIQIVRSAGGSPVHSFLEVRLEEEVVRTPG